MVATDPLWEPSLSYDETELRKMDSALVMADGTALGSRAGVRPGDAGFAVSLAGTTVNVTAGTATLTRAGQGVYRAQLAATSPGTLAAANASFARIDLVYLRVWDTAVDSSGLRKADTVLLTGTPSGSPAVPTPGATEIYIPLATINVPSTGGGGTGAATVSTAIRQVTVAPGGILPVSSTVDIAAPGTYTGQARYNLARNMPEYWNGTAWYAQGDWSSFTPTFTALGGGASIGNGTIYSRWHRFGNTVYWHGEMTIGSTTNGGTNLWFLSMPTLQATGTGIGFTRLGPCNYISGGNNYVGLVSCNPADGGKATLIAKTSFSSTSFDNISAINPTAMVTGAKISWSVEYEAP
ncbi:hypothetical protein [Kitasatospora sp. A2-31]|uniref:hypothetical protein n=1 Tax=Kitasatospora sp. A2-31 TaxID=2916414 RepID=UPI001EECF6E0|nr:hypothetical protein [Kitasatospora sp. A2-31]MCG6499469.1 hypothetical protein [Kitasatospora sp. A2-31]